MRQNILFTLLIFAPLALLSSLQPTAATAAPLACTQGTQPSGALYEICMPNSGWNGELILYAHGYVTADDPLALPAEATAIATFANFRGYGFATTSYRTNGLAVLPGVEDLLELVELFKAAEGEPSEIYLIGISEGGLITALSVEQHSSVYSGGLAACGPIGSFQAQLDYITNFRLIFDYFFPGLMPGEPDQIPQSLIDDFDTHFANVIEPVVTDLANADRVEQLLLVTNAPFDLINARDTIYDALRYNVIGTNDAIAKLGGNPFGNVGVVYSGTADDDALNAAIQRYTADPAAVAAVVAYETSGQLTVPIVTLHTTLDAIVPYWQEPLYLAKVITQDNLAQHDEVAVETYGHCTFSTNDLLAAFDLLVDRVKNPPAYEPVSRVYLPVVEFVYEP